MQDLYYCMLFFRGNNVGSLLLYAISKQIVAKIPSLHNFPFTLQCISVCS
jgi:hypothetical protein